MDQVENNPAQLLLSFLKRFQELEGSELSVKRGIIRVLDLHDGATSSEVYAGLNRLHRLVDHCDAELTAIPKITKGNYLQHLAGAKDFISPESLDMELRQYASSKDLENVINMVAVVEYIICRDVNGPAPKEAAKHARGLEEIRRDIDELQADVLKSKINSTLQNILLDLVEKMRRCVGEYQIRGVRGLREEFILILDQLRLRSEIIRKESQDPESRALLKEVFDILGRTNTLTALALRLPPIYSSLEGYASLAGFLTGGN